jgi:hypothetical protein
MVRSVFHSLLFAGLAFPEPAAAENFVNGDTLLAWCEDRDGRDLCSGYIVGVIDGEFLAKSDGHRALYCLPRKISSDAVREVVVTYLKLNPLERDATAASVLAVALYNKWPCANASMGQR